MTTVLILTVLLVALVGLLRYVSLDRFAGPQLRRPGLLSERRDELGRLRPYVHLR